jgi:CRP-like cAMP-binding protein
VYFEEQKREAAGALLARLAQVNLLRSLPPDEMEGLLPYVRQIEVPAGEVIFRAGEPGDALYLVDRGAVEIRPDGVSSQPSPPDDGYAPLAKLGPGESFGEMALLSGDPRSAGAVAAEDTVLLRISKHDFDHLIVRSPGLREAVEQLNLERVLRSVRSASSVDAERWRETAMRSIRRVSRAEHDEMARQAVAEHGSNAPTAMFLGTVLDGIPECIMIGARFTTFTALNPSFVIAVFLNNLPEAMSSAVGMQNNGLSRPRILGMWSSLVLFGGIVAGLGNLFLASAPPAITAFASGIAGGAILAMLAATMMPEAFEEGGPSVGLATIAGFLSAFLFAVLALR